MELDLKICGELKWHPVTDIILTFHHLSARKCMDVVRVGGNLGVKAFHLLSPWADKTKFTKKKSDSIRQCNLLPVVFLTPQMYSYQDSQQSQAERPAAESADHEWQLWGRQHMMSSRNIPLV